MPVTSEQTMSARDLVAAYDAGRTAHMESRVVPGAMGRDGKPMQVDVLVVTAEAKSPIGVWCYINGVGTDLNDEAEPVFLDLEPRQRVVLTMNDSVVVRGLSEEQ